MSMLSLFKWTEGVVIAWCWIRSVRRMEEDMAIELPPENLHPVDVGLYSA